MEKILEKIKGMADIEYFSRLLGKIPLYPRLVYPYKVHWSWNLTYKCNYKCSYCDVIKEDKKYEYDFQDLSKWEGIIESLFSKYWSGHFRFSGGEPSIYPGFFEFLGKLLEKNTADITTNLSFDVEKFKDLVPPDKGLSVSASFHPQFADIKTFMKKVISLHHNGYPSTVTVVAYPAHLRKMEYYKNTIEGENIYFKQIPFKGKYWFKSYPDSYSKRQKKFLKKVAEGSKYDDMKELNMAWFNHNFQEDEEVKIDLNHYGDRCGMGHRYAVVHPNFIVTRCCYKFIGVESGVLGRIDDSDFRLLDDPGPCQVQDDCPCYKALLFEKELSCKDTALWETLPHPVYTTEKIKEYIEYLKNLD